MKRLMKGMVLLSILSLCACATTRPELKSPCDPLQCKNRVNVNTWYKG